VLHGAIKAIEAAVVAASSGVHATVDAGIVASVAAYTSGSTRKRLGACEGTELSRCLAFVTVALSKLFAAVLLCSDSCISGTCGSLAERINECPCPSMKAAGPVVIAADSEPPLLLLVLMMDELRLQCCRVVLASPGSLVIVKPTENC
jgi:hypothetical protein